jgi:hypothetical protein
MRERLINLTTSDPTTPSKLTKKPITTSSSRIQQVLRSPVLRALQAVGAVGVLAACVAQAVMRALGVLGPSLWVGTSTASLSAVVVAGLAVSAVRALGVTPVTPTKKNDEEGVTSTTINAAAGGISINLN